MLSFLASQPVQGSRTILGHLPLGGGLEDFREEPEFLYVLLFLFGEDAAERSYRKLLHTSIKDALRMGKAESVEFEASTRPSDGYIHITGMPYPHTKIVCVTDHWVDERAIPPAGRIGETEDLIGSVFVQDGKVGTSSLDPRGDAANED